MKKNIILTAAFVASLLLGACNEALEYKDVVYFSGTEATNTTTMYVDGTASTSFSVTSSNKVAEDLEVYVDIDEAALAAFGERMGAEYEMIPLSSFMEPNEDGTYGPYEGETLIIAAGKNSSVPVKFEVNNMNDFVEGVNYCIPFKIAGNSQGLDNLEASQYLYVLISPVIETKAMYLANSWYITMEGMKGDPRLDNLSGCTIEMRICARGYSSMSHKIASFIGVEENFLLRMGDVSVDKDQIQFAGKASITAQNTRVQLNKWYHVAVVDTGSELTVYVNGEPEASTASTSSMKVTNLGYYYNSAFSIGRSADDYRRFNGYVSEGRAWNRALTSIELKNNLCYVDVENAVGLVGYWRCDTVEADGVTVPDISGNGYHGTASKTVTADDFVTIKCPVLE